MGFAVEPSTEISHRTDFALLANARGYVDAVEVGTDQAVFARDFLSRFKGNWLWLVDPYEPFEERPYDRTGDLMTAAVALAPFHGRYRFVRARSVDAAPWVAKHITPEFCYIDGAHDYESVRADLAAWWSVLPLDRGMLAGHDFDDDHPDVRRAVEEFARQRKLVVRLTADSPASWYTYRVEPEELVVKYFRDAAEPNPRFQGAR